LLLAPLLFLLLSLSFYPAGCGVSAGNSATDLPTLSGDGCLVLCYHRFAASNPLSRLYARWPPSDEIRRFTVLSDDFAGQLAYLRECGVYFADLRELEQYIKGELLLPRRSVLVTIDDVDISVYRVAFPLLRSRRVPFVLFVISGQVGRADWHGLSLCGWAELDEMVESGLAAIGSHTHDYHRLGEDGHPVFWEAGEALAADLSASRRTFKDQLGLDVYSLAYPYGFGTPRTDDIAARCGMRLVFSLRDGVVRPGDDPLFIERVLVNRETWPAVVEWMRSGIRGWGGR